ncbi:MAG: hypothetical protein AAF725_19320 [Acidobacteriota bacterium]
MNPTSSAPRTLGRVVPRAWAASGLLVALLATPLYAQANRDYRAGKQAAEEGRWSEVESKMRAAIANDPEARRKTFSRYSPYYYLGVALEQQGDCRGALDAWQQTDRYKALKAGGEEEKDLALRRNRCTKLVNDVKLARVQAEQAVERAEDAAESLARLSRHQTLSSLWGSGSPSFASRQREIAGQLEQAKARIGPAASGLDAGALGEVRAAAEDVEQRFEAVVADAELRLGEVNASIRGAMGELDKAERSARTLLRSVGRVAPYPQRLGSQVSTLRRVLAKIDRDRNSASAESLEALTEELIRETRALRPLAERPPAALLDAGAAYLANDFQGVLDLLAIETFSRERTRFHATLLQAAAIHGLFVMGGAQDEELLMRTQTLLRQLAEMDPALGAPGERFFSPRFRALFEETARAVSLERQEAEAAKQALEEGVTEGEEPSGDAAAGTATAADEQP